MPDLLLELRCEEIPARMQRKAAGDLRKTVTDGLVEAGLIYEGAQEYWTPRRLTLDIRGLSARSKDVREERRGPSTKAPEQAIAGFLRSAGLTDISQAHVHTDPKKGDFYVAHLVKPGRAAEEIIAELAPAVIRAFPWPKSMRWGAASAKPGSLRWVRPLQSIVCTFGPETEEPVVIPFEVDGIRSGNTTWGHRFHAPAAIPVRRFDDYVAKLEAARVVLDAERRKAIILSDARNLAFASGLELVEDEALLEEVAGLVEWPVVLMGEFEPEFLEIPAEVIRLTIRANQKCFVTRPAAGGELSNRFILTANIEASDGGAEIARGNGKVVRARLSDALYFWNADQADLPDLDRLQGSAEKFGLRRGPSGNLLPLDQRMARLDHLGVTFHAKLGTQGERMERVRRLAEELAPLVGADPGLASRAAVLAKADLTTEVVGEFPELQGLIGRKYAALQGEHPSVAAAIEEHYRPQGPSDRVPTDPVSIAVALADKLDTLVCFWAIDEKPTGSKDPYALRRAALGVIRMVVENGVRVGLLRTWHQAFLRAYSSLRIAAITPVLTSAAELATALDDATADQLQYQVYELVQTDDAENRYWAWYLTKAEAELLAFFHERLKVYLRDKGARHDLIDAVLAAGAKLISPLEGEMPGRAEGGTVPPASPPLTHAEIRRDDQPQAPPSGLPPISPSRGEISQPSTPDGPPSRGEPRSRDSASVGNDDLLTIVRRVEALGAMLDTSDGKNLLAGTKRAVNILAAEEKKGTLVGSEVHPPLFADEAEHALFAAVNQAESQAAQAIQREDFSAAVTALSALREPVDSFFERVLVNVEDAELRANRLALLARIRAATGQVADFSKIAG